MKKGVKLLTILIGIVIVIMLSLSLINYTFAQSNDDEDKQKAEEYGENIDEFLANEDDIEHYISFYPEEFIKGVKKNPEGTKKLVELFMLKEGDKFRISDKAKNKLWDIIIKDKKLLKEFAEKARERLSKTYKGFFDEPLKEFSIDEKSLQRLEWRGSKLGIIGIDGELRGWIDFDDLPAYTENIQIKDVNGKTQFGLGYSGFMKRFDSGSIDFEEFIVAPNGVRFGSNIMGLKNIKYNQETGKFEIDYYDIDGKEQSFELSKDDLGDASLDKHFANLLDIIDDDKFKSSYKAQFGVDLDKEGLKKIMDDVAVLREKLKKLDIKSIQDASSKKNWNKIPPEMQGDIEKTKQDLSVVKDEIEKMLLNLQERFSQLQIPTANNINIGFLKKGSKTGEIFFSFDEDDGLVIKAKDGAVAVSTLINGKGGLGISANPDTGKEGEFHYNFIGELVAHKNAEARIFGADGIDRAIVKSYDDLTEIRLIRSSIADAIASGDWNKLLNSIEYHSDIISNILIQQDPKKIRESIKLLESQITNENLEFEVRNRIYDAVDTLKRSLVLQTQEMVEKMFDDKTRETFSETFSDQNVVRLREMTLQQTKNALRRLTEPKNAELITAYLTDKKNPYKKEAYETLIKDTLKEYVKGYETVLDSSISDSIIEGLLTVNEDTYSESEIIANINDFIDSSDLSLSVEGNIEVYTPELIRRHIDSVLAKSGLSDRSQRDALSSSMTDLIRNAVLAIDEQKKVALDRVLSDIAESSNYENRNILFLDVETGELIYYGENKASVDIKMPLRKVNIKHRDTGDKNSNFELTSFGYPIATFKGDETHAPRNFKGQGRIANIASIVNLNIPEHELMTLSYGQKYGIFDTKSSEGKNNLRYITNHYGSLTVVGIPLAGYMPIITHQVSYIKDILQGDPGLDPYAKLQFNLILQPAREAPRGGLFSRLFNRIANRVAAKKIGSDAIPKAQQQLYGSMEEIKSDFGPMVDQYLDEYGIAGVAGASSQLSTDVLNYAKNNGVDIPNEPAIRDLVSIVDIVGNPDEVKSQVYGFVQFVQRNVGQIRPGMSFVVSNKGIQMGNRLYTGFDDAVMRQIMREADAWHHILPSHFTRHMSQMR